MYKSSMMKKILASILTVMITFSLWAGDLTEMQVPAAVKNAITKKYGEIRNIDWEKKGVFYQAEFTKDRREHEVLLDEKGNIVKIYEDISESELPQKAIQTIKSDYSEYKISEVERITKDGSVLYKVELKFGERDVDVYFNHTGEITKMPIN